MNDINIRNIPKEQFPDSLRLSEFAFQYTVPPEEWETKLAQLKENEQWGAYVDGKLAAKLTILELHTWIQGRRWKLGGIASVATWPEYRRGGLVSRLLANALKVMREEGQSISFLHPFQFAFYRKFGWETYTETKKYEIPTALLPKLPPQPGRVVRTGDDSRLLGTIYNAYALRYNGTLDRDEAWWQHRIFAMKQGTTAVCYNEDGEPNGYVRYAIRDRICQIHELVHLDRSAWKALWKFISDHDSMLDKVTISLPSHDQLPFLLDNPRIKQETIPYFMARIVDVEQFITHYPFRPTAEGAAFGLRVTDAHAEWNNGLFTVKIGADGAAVVEKSAQEKASVTVACDITTLTALLMGYQGAGFLHEIERLEGDEEGIQLLERLIEKRTTYLPDFF